MEKMPIPVTKDKTHPTEKFRFLSARRSTTGRAKVRLRVTNRMPLMAAIQAQVLIVLSSNQFRNAGIVRALEEAEIRLVDIDQKRGQKRDR